MKMIKMAMATMERVTMEMDPVGKAGLDRMICSRNFHLQNIMNLSAMKPVIFNKNPETLAWFISRTAFASPRQSGSSDKDGQPCE